MHKNTARIAVAALLAGGALVPATAPASTAATIPHYKNCAALTKAYPHGVKASSKAVDRYRASGKVKSRASRATVNAKVYAANKKLDADKDGIACER